MAALEWKDAARRFFARALFGLGDEWDAWDARYELVHGGDSVICDARPAGSARLAAPPDVVILLDERALVALHERRYGDVLHGAEMSGRFSHACILKEAIQLAPGAPRPSEGSITGFFPLPDERRALVSRLLRRLRPRKRFERLELMLRMWSFETSAPSTAGRLADYVIPDAEVSPWLEAETFPLFHLAQEALPELASETEPLARGEVRLPHYHAADATDVWDSTAPVVWGRGTLFAEGSRREAALARFPAAARVLDAALPSRLVNLSFLTLDPDVKLARHADGNPLFASWHFGVHVPRECAVEIGAERREHAIGRALAFDDSYLHRAWNHSDRIRVLLSAWLLHPALDDEEASVVTSLLPELGWGRA